ncbi:MAG TPA: hypothetical protein VL983_08545 [Terriglobales bacterium]|nr:hypothetical protein [Terriglobales bacterium]
MILGMSTATFTLLHVLVSLIAIASGFVVVFGLIRGNRMDRSTALFLATTTLTSVSGFAFPFARLLPSHVLGVMSLALLAFAIPARYLFHLTGPWRWIYVLGATLTLYFNFFVLIVQCFEKIPTLRAIAPTQKEPPFLVAQIAALIAFATLTVFATLRFHPERVQTA